MLTPILLLIGIVGGSCLLVGVLEQRHRLNELTRPPARPKRPLLLVFRFPTQTVDAVTQQRAVQAIAPALLEQIEIIFVSVFDQLEYAAQFGVFTVPATLLLDARGQVAFVNQSFVTAAQIQSQIEQTLNLTLSHSTSLPAPTQDAFRFKELPCQS